MKSDNAVNEHFRHRCSSVGVTEDNEVGILRESVHDCEYHQFAVQLLKPFDEVL